MHYGIGMSGTKLSTNVLAIMYTVMAMVNRVCGCWKNGNHTDRYLKMRVMMPMLMVDVIRKCM